MEYSLIIIMLSLIQYTVFGARTGIARVKYNVPAPKCSGNETWERINRVHQNTLEQLIVFIPSLLTFSYYVSSKWAVLPGIGFLIARQIFSHRYIGGVKSRLFPLTLLVNAVLVIGSLIGIVLSIPKM